MGDEKMVLLGRSGKLNSKTVRLPLQGAQVVSAIRLSTRSLVIIRPA